MLVQIGVAFLVPLSLVAAILPDWKSLDSVRRAHSVLEIAALVFFALLVLFDVLAHVSDNKNTERRFEKIGLWFFGVAVLAEIAAYPYSQRNDALSDQEMAALRKSAGDAKQSALDAAGAATRANTEATGAETKAEAVGKEADKAEAKIAAVNGQVEMTQLLLSARRVRNSDPLIAALKQDFKGQAVFLTSYAGDEEAWGLCTQLSYIAQSAEMKPTNACGQSGMGRGALISPLTVSGPSEAEAQKLSTDLAWKGGITFGTGTSPNVSMLTIFVGVKPPVIIGETDQTRAAEKAAKNKPTAKPRR